MRRRLTNAITMGLGLAGCTARDLPGDSADGPVEQGASSSDTGGMPSTTGATTPTTTTQTSSSTSTDDRGSDVSEDDGEEPRYDVSSGGVTFDVAPFTGFECQGDPQPPSTFDAACEVGREWATVCVPRGEAGCPDPHAPEIGEALYACYGGRCYVIGSSCGPVEGEEACCYWGTAGQTCPGRPLLVDGVARTAPLELRADWCDAWSAASRTDHDELLARAWLYDAQHEHAAIASFSRFAMQLLAIAAPPRFVERALQAAIDEREHATLFFGLARAHGGAALGPGALDIRGLLDGADDLVAIVVATVREGCIAETISAMQLERARTSTTDPALRDALAHVVDQELEHVDLAWSFVAWAYARGDARLRAAVEHAFATAWEHVPRASDVEPPARDAASWRAHGRLTHVERAAVATSTLRTIIEPAAREMFVRASTEARRVDVCGATLPA